ncbi:MAG: response regulator transcription factor [Chloroflexota bacterium]
MMAPLTETNILLVDDDPLLLSIMESVLNFQGAKTHTAINGEIAWQMFQTLDPDLVVVDLMMPKMSGHELCQRIRQISDAPILMLTALDADKHIVQGLRSGADDYVVKPISNEVLIAHLEALLRRANRLKTISSQSGAYDDGYLVIEPEKQAVQVGGKAINLSNIEYRLLCYLVTHANEIIPWKQILTAIWGEDYAAEKNNTYVRRYIAYLRAKIEMDPQSPTYIITRRGVGYMFRTQSP